MALTIAEDIGTRPLQAQCLFGLSRLQKMGGNEVLGKQSAADAMALNRDMGIKLLPG
jgi:hypothetical protein